MEEEGRLHNPEIRENFIGRIFINFRWNAFIKEFSVNNFMLFHQSIKYTLMAHSPSNLKEMGKIVANTNPDLLHSSVVITSYSIHYTKLYENTHNMTELICELEKSINKFSL